MRIFPIIKKTVVNLISGAINYRANVRPATRATLVATLRAAFQRPASRVSLAPATLRAALQRPATRATGRVVDSLVKPPQRPASRVSMAPALLIAGQQRPASRQSMGPAVLTGAKPRAAGNIVQVQWDLNHASYATGSVNEVANTKNWTAPGNAVGAPDGTLAAFDGDALLLAIGLLNNQMVGQVGRPTSLVILEVYLDFYGSVAGLPLVSDLVSRLNLRYRVGTGGVPGYVTLESITTGDSNFLSTPKSYRINRTGVDAAKFSDGATAALSTDVTWANITQVRPAWDAQTILGLVAAHYRADAVRLRVVAAETQLN